MTEEPLPPVHNDPAYPAPTSHAPADPELMEPQPTRTSALPWLCGLGFLLLAGAIYYVWQFPNIPAATTDLRPQISDIQQKTADVDTRLTGLEHQPAPASAADLTKLSARLDALEARIPDQAKLNSRLDALEHQTADLSNVNARLDALEHRTADQPQITTRLDALDHQVTDQAQLGNRLNELSGQVQSMAEQDKAARDANKQQMDQATDQARTSQQKTADQLAKLEQAAGSAQTVSARVGQVASIQAAYFALAAGRPLGQLPNAPPAVARYADAAPPTEAQLRLSFPQVEQAATATDQPGDPATPFLDRALQRAEGLVTVRHGTDVVVGNTPVVALTRARTALDAGDLQAAIDALSTANPAVQKAAADWLAQAKALVAARSGLAEMAAHA